MKNKIIIPIVIFLFCHTISICAETAAAQPTPTSFAYVLQAEKLASSRKKVVALLTKCDRDWIVLDMAFQGNQLWTKTEITTIRQGKKNRKVIAYLSIGEAEDYRSYWNKEWQQIIAKQIETIMAIGFDGLYLDKVDAYEEYEYDPQTKDWIDHRRNTETNRTYREDMILFGKKVAAIARKLSPHAIIIPQNGEQLLTDNSWLRTIDAIGIEDLFSDGEKMQSKQSILYRKKQTDQCAKQGKPVLLIDYSTNKKSQQKVRTRSKQKHYLLLITDRALTMLGK